MLMYAMAICGIICIVLITMALSIFSRPEKTKTDNDKYPIQNKRCIRMTLPPDVFPLFILLHVARF